MFILRPTVTFVYNITLRCSERFCRIEMDFLTKVRATAARAVVRTRDVWVRNTPLYLHVTFWWQVEESNLSPCRDGEHFHFMIHKVTNNTRCQPGIGITDDNELMFLQSLDCLRVRLVLFLCFIQTTGITCPGFHREKPHECKHQLSMNAMLEANGEAQLVHKPQPARTAISRLKKPKCVAYSALRLHCMPRTAEMREQNEISSRLWHNTRLEMLC
jgi:hypothetical protein